MNQTELNKQVIRRFIDEVVNFFAMPLRLSAFA